MWIYGVLNDNAINSDSYAIRYEAINCIVAGYDFMRHAYHIGFQTEARLYDFFIKPDEIIQNPTPNLAMRITQLLQEIAKKPDSELMWVDMNQKIKEILEEDYE